MKGKLNKFVNIISNLKVNKLTNYERKIFIIGVTHLLTQNEFLIAVKEETLKDLIFKIVASISK